MTRQKKIQKYVPQTVWPKRNQEWRLFDREGVKPSEIIGYVRQRSLAINAARGDNYIPYESVLKGWESGQWTDDNFRAGYADWKYNRLCTYAFRCSPQFRRINEQFLAEFNSREDLQEIYRECVSGRTWYYDENDNCHEMKSDNPLRQAPSDFIMYDGFISRNGRSMIELARETPYVEGDLVVLRDTAIGLDADPLRVNRWSANYTPGMQTPDKTVKRIGTVISVTGELAQSWRPVKGSKVMKIMWMGLDEVKVVDVEERYVKFHERQTYANGMKVRPQLDNSNTGD